MTAVIVGEIVPQLLKDIPNQPDEQRLKVSRIYIASFLSLTVNPQAVLFSNSSGTNTASAVFLTVKNAKTDGRRKSLSKSPSRCRTGKPQNETG